MKKVTILFIAFLMLFSANVFAVDYNLYVAGVQVSDENKDNITSALVAAGKDASGTITYNPVSNTLTLDSANISATNDGIKNYTPNLTINLVGENTITVSNHGIDSYSDCKITGNGSLNINSNYYGIYIKQDNLTIENTTVTIYGNVYGFCGINGTCTITKSTVKVTGTDYGTWIGNLVLNACEIVQPEGAIFDAGKHGFCLNGIIVKTEVVIEPVIYTVSGTVTYGTNPIEGVTITYNDETTTTATNGTYSFTATENTNYTVTASKTGYTFTPATKTVNVAQADVTGVIFFGTADGTPVDETIANTFSVYPNPSNGLVNVVSNEAGEINVFDITGKLVYTANANADETTSFELNVAGMYVVKQNGNITKIVVE